MFKPEQSEYSEEIVKNDGFWPDLSVEDFERRRTIPADINKELLVDMLINAVAEINRQLSAVAAGLQAKGYTKAATVPGVSVGDESHLSVQYRKAVYARAKADLIGEYASLGRKDGHAGQDSPDTRGALLAESSYTVRSIKGLPRVGVSVQ